MLGASTAEVLRSAPPISGEPVVAVEAGIAVVPAGLSPLDVHVGGRVWIAPLPSPHGALRYVHEWPGVYFEAAFVGDRVVLKFDDAANEYRLRIDGNAPVTLARPGRSLVRVSGLYVGLHQLRLEKVTESISIVGAFDGFYIPSGAKPRAARPPVRLIQFIGYSGMTGYGVRSTPRVCTKEEVRLRNDTQKAYPALVARHFDADYQIDAISGRGMVRNYDGTTPDVPMSRVYRYVLPSSKVGTPVVHRRPQIIFVFLFGNDFFKPLHAGEQWRDQDALVADYAQTYRHFVVALHRESPAAALPIACRISAVQTLPPSASSKRRGRGSSLRPTKRGSARSCFRLCRSSLWTRPRAIITAAWPIRASASRTASWRRG